MKKKTKSTKHKYNCKGKLIDLNVEVEEYEDEPISKDIISSITDFYNLMHLINKAWVNEKYRLKIDNDDVYGLYAGYNIYDKENRLSAWIGMKEKYETLMFIIYSFSELCVKVYGSEVMVNYDCDEDICIYSELKIADILKEENAENQVKIIKDWIRRDIEKIL